MRLLLHDPEQSRWLSYAAPVDVVTAERMADVWPALAAIERRVNDEGLHAAGFVCYEAAAGFDAALQTREPGALPLLAFGLYDAADVVPRPAFPDDDAGEDLSWQIDGSRERYAGKIDRIRAQIAEGNSYQVNYTLRSRAAGASDPWSLFSRVAHDAPYAAYIETAGHVIASASPELFFRLDGERLVSRPMKGTAPRGLTAAEDRALGEGLSQSGKNRAENVMIADMIRNDMGRISIAGSVTSESLYRIEKFPTVWQATSTISARSQRSVADIFAATFPCASITGAPKVASMRLIRALEDSPRGIYTGAIGYLSPGRQAQFSVAIRTITVDKESQQAEYGVGGGIVWDSAADDEYAECLTKARVLSARRPRAPFELLETLRWTRDEGYFLLESHLERLQASAGYFDFRCDVDALRKRLQVLVADFDSDRQRLRLLLSRDGGTRLEHCALESPGAPDTPRLRLAAEPVDSSDVRLYHKTTDRGIYERALADAGDCDDVLLWNERREVTESSIANVVLRLGDELVTPPVRCGLLAGRLRAAMLANGEIQERIVTLDDLPRASAVFLVNSLRGRRAAVLQTE